MTERKEEPDADRALSLLHQLARDVVDRGDMIGINGVPQTEPVSQQCRAEIHGLVMKSAKRPGRTHRGAPPGGRRGGVPGPRSAAAFLPQWQ